MNHPSSGRAAAKLVISGRPLVAGEAEADALASTEPLSFWGGYDQETGEIIDRRHPLSGANAAGHVLILPLTRGSSTTTAVFLEAVRRGTAPAAIVTHGVDRFMTLASIVADELYGNPVPVVSVSEQEFEALQGARRVRVESSGKVTVLE